MENIPVWVISSRYVTTISLFWTIFCLSLFFMKLTAVNSVQTSSYLLPYMSSNIYYTLSYLWMHPCGTVLRYLKVPEYTQITPPGGVIWVYLHSLVPTILDKIFENFSVFLQYNSKPQVNGN